MKNFSGKLELLDRETKIVAVAALLCVIVTLFLSANTVKYYTRRKVSVHATVTAMEMYNNSTAENSDWGYDVFVDYGCLGKKYKNVHYGQVSVDTGLKEGSKLDFEVYADEPDKVAQNTFGNSWIFLAFSVMMIAVSAGSIRRDLNVGKGKKGTEDEEENGAEVYSDRC